MEKKNHKLNKWVTFKGLKDNLGVPYLHLWIHLLQVHHTKTRTVYTVACNEHEHTINALDLNKRPRISSFNMETKENTKKM